MKTIIIQEAFSAYPAGKLRAFAAGEEVDDLNDADADVYVAKALAREKEPADATPAKVKKESTK